MGVDQNVVVAREMGIQAWQVEAVDGLLTQDCTVPFIARYRKEATGTLDEVQIAAVRDRLQQIAALEKRKEAVIASLQERELLTDELARQIESAQTLAVLEDLYLPYRPKRRTRATIAREKGLEPLARTIFAQAGCDPSREAKSFLNEEKGVASVDEALAGARDIMAEWISEDAQSRATMRDFFFQSGILSSRVAKGKQSEESKFRDYFSWEEEVKKMPGHRILAVLRGENEGELTLRIRPPEEQALARLKRRHVRNSSPDGEQVMLALEDGYGRLLAPSLETEVRNALKQRADEEAIRVFTENVRELLLGPPLGQKRIMALDPGFRTGAKMACLDAQGTLLHYETLYLLDSGPKSDEAARTIVALCRKFSIEAIAVGNGTGGRETEAFLRSLELPKEISLVLVDERGASVYSASPAARDEFPDHDVTVRGAVSIGRRLADPLAELVKIDPKSIGVGQYQHDVDQAALKRSLDDVVISCVNSVGVEVNTAGKELLAYVSGIGPTLAKNIVTHRNAHGPFKSRTQLLKVTRLGPKAFQQSAGFLRILNGKHPLDAGAVHPERYPVVERMAKDLGCSVQDLMAQAALREKIDLKRYVTDDVGLPTLTDIVEELAKPGRDPRKSFEAFQFAENVSTIDDLRPGMRVPGIVTNVTKFGAFVDIGVHRDGLVHVSELADRYVNDPSEVVKVNQQVMVTVLEVDNRRNRISLSLRSKGSQN
jgi:protein Tex